MLYRHAWVAEKEKNKAELEEVLINPNLLEEKSVKHRFRALRATWYLIIELLTLTKLKIFTNSSVRRFNVLCCSCLIDLLVALLLLLFVFDVDVVAIHWEHKISKGKVEAHLHNDYSLEGHA